MMQYRVQPGSPDPVTCPAGQALFRKTPCHIVIDMRDTQMQQPGR